MITQITKDCQGKRLSPGQGERYAEEIEDLPPLELKAGIPVAFQDWHSDGMAGVELTGGEWVAVPAEAVDLHEPEETLTALADEMGIAYPTLLSAVQRGDVLARKSGRGQGTWLTTRRAVKAAGIKRKMAKCQMCRNETNNKRRKADGNLRLCDNCRTGKLAALQAQAEREAQTGNKRFGKVTYKVEG